MEEDREREDRQAGKKEIRQATGQGGRDGGREAVREGWREGRECKWQKELGIDVSQVLVNTTSLTHPCLATHDTWHRLTLDYSRVQPGASHPTRPLTLKLTDTNPITPWNLYVTTDSFLITNTWYQTLSDTLKTLMTLVYVTRHVTYGTPYRLCLTLPYTLASLDTHHYHQHQITPEGRYEPVRSPSWFAWKGVNIKINLDFPRTCLFIQPTLCSSVYACNDECNLCTYLSVFKWVFTYSFYYKGAHPEKKYECP